MMREQPSRQVILQVLAQVAPEADIDHVDPAQSFRDQFGIDSIDFLNFVIGLEDRIGTRIAERDYPRLSSLDGCLAYLEAVARAGNDAAAS